MSLPLACVGLLGEGAVQVLYNTDEYITDPILAAVGQLQFEVVQYRMKVRTLSRKGGRGVGLPDLRLSPK